MPEPAQIPRWPAEVSDRLNESADPRGRSLYLERTSSVPVLETPRLVLDELTTADAEFILKTMSGGWKLRHAVELPEATVENEDDQ